MVIYFTVIWVLAHNTAPSSSLLNFNYLNLLNHGERPGPDCSVNGRGGHCMFSMACAWANGIHLGVCRDRFLFGSCCELPLVAPVLTLPVSLPLPRPLPVPEAVEADLSGSWEEDVNGRPLSEVCGRRHEDSKARIQGGVIANRTSWPWQAGIRLQHAADQTYHHCGAVLLNHGWVATAAHCVYRRDKPKLTVLLGDYNNKEWEAVEAERGVAEIIIHPEYNNRNYDNDLALLRLDQPVDYTSYIIPICLPGSSLKIAGKKGYVTGWGRIYDEGPEPSLLNEVDVPILSNSDCNSLFKLAALDEHVQEDIWVCAGYREGGKDACDGDSGGPLSVADIQGETTIWTLGGIISWGPSSCGERYRPGVYTRIPNYVAWIGNIIQVEPYDWSRLTPFPK